MNRQFFIDYTLCRPSKWCSNVAMATLIDISFCDVSGEIVGQTIINDAIRAKNELQKQTNERTKTTTCGMTWGMA